MTTELNQDFSSQLFEQHFDIEGFLIANKAATYFFRVGSSAMAQAGINVGDRLVVDRSIKAKNRDTVVAVHEGQFLVRRLHSSNGRVELAAENEGYPLITIEDNEQLDIWGVVVGLVRKF
jgi:DNA polymerase V